MRSFSVEKLNNHFLLFLVQTMASLHNKIYMSDDASRSVTCKSEWKDETRGCGFCDLKLFPDPKDSTDTFMAVNFK